MITLVTLLERTKTNVAVMSVTTKVANSIFTPQLWFVRPSLISVVLVKSVTTLVKTPSGADDGDKKQTQLRRERRGGAVSGGASSHRVTPQRTARVTDGWAGERLSWRAD